jgi:hypothetical protein
MPKLLGFRDYDEHDVINLFTLSGTYDTRLPNGTFVKVGGSGWRIAETNNFMLGDPGAHYNNTVSQRWGTQPYVIACSSTGETTIGMTLLDIRELDENGEKLIYKPRKKAEMQCVLSGETVPVVTRGVFLYSGVFETVAAGQTAYVSGTQLSNNATNQTPGSTVGTFLSAKDANGWVLLKLNVQ